jgi:hypothetical protein
MTSAYMSDVSVFMVSRMFATRCPEHDVFASGTGKGDRQHVLVRAVLSNWVVKWRSRDWLGSKESRVAFFRNEVLVVENNVEQ